MRLRKLRGGSSRKEIWDNIAKYIPKGIKWYSKCEDASNGSWICCRNKCEWYGSIFFVEGFVYGFWASKFINHDKTPTKEMFFGLGLWNSLSESNIFFKNMFYFPPASVKIQSKSTDNSFSLEFASYCDTYFFTKAARMSYDLNKIKGLIDYISNLIRPEFFKFACFGIGRAVWNMRPSQFDEIIAFLNTLDDKSAKYIATGMGLAMTYTRVQYPLEIKSNIEMFAAYSGYVEKGTLFSLETISILHDDAFDNVKKLYDEQFPNLTSSLRETVPSLIENLDTAIERLLYYSDY